MERIKIDDGSKLYEIVNTDDRVIGKFAFNPSDANLVAKYEAVIEKLQDYFKEIQAGVMTKERFIEAQDTIVDKFSELVGEDASKTFFSICGPFTPMANGNLYLETVIEAVYGIIEKETKKRMKKVQSQMDKYLDGYKENRE